MNKLMLALLGLVISLPTDAATLRQAEDAITAFTDTSDFYVFGEDGFFKEPCSGEVEVDNNVFRLTVIKLSSQKKIDIEFNKVTGRTQRGEQVSVAKIDRKVGKLQIVFAVSKPGAKKADKLLLKIESKGTKKTGERVAQIDLSSSGTQLGCKGVEN